MIYDQQKEDFFLICRKSGTSQSSCGGLENDQGSSQRDESSETSLTIALQVIYRTKTPKVMKNYDPLAKLN